MSHFQNIPRIIFARTCQRENETVEGFAPERKRKKKKRNNIS